MPDGFLVDMRLEDGSRVPVRDVAGNIVWIRLGTDAFPEEE